MKVILGLGNPGRQYEATRHNVGWWLLDHLAGVWRFDGWKRDGEAMVTTATIHGTRVRMIKPLTYMNLSGAVLRSYLRRTLWAASRDLLVVVDEVALPVGRYRIRARGSAGGHNGLKSVEGSLQRQDYARLRIGVGPKPTEIDDLADYVLAEFTREERQVLEDLLDPMSEAVECWLMEGIEKAMSKHNKSANSEP